MTKSSVNKKRKKVEVTISYNKKVAKKFHKTEYYASTAANIKSLPQREKEKNKLSTPRTQLVTGKISEFKGSFFPSFRPSLRRNGSFGGKKEPSLSCVATEGTLSLSCVATEGTVPSVATQDGWITRKPGKSL
jgi:hypothetical protein